MDQQISGDHNTQNTQNVDGSGNLVVQNSRGVNVTQYVNLPPYHVSDEDVAEARALFARLPAEPADLVPEPAADLPTHSRMPLSRNDFFVGRQHDLKQLASTIKGGDTAAISPIAAATGIGGIGKSQLAVEFAYRYGRYFLGGVFWLSFADAASVRAELAACGNAQHLALRADYANLPLDEQVRLVLSAFQSPLTRLLIFDNCEDERLLAQWRPPHGGCRIIVTSRRSSWDPTLGVHPHPLGVLDRSQSIQLLRKFRPDLPADDANLDAIADELGDLPLAVHLAGSYLARYRHSVTLPSYLAELRDPRLLDHASLTGHKLTISPTAHDLHVVRTFAISFDRLDPTDPTDSLALKLLARAAHLAPGEPIPRDLLLATLASPDNTSPQQDGGGYSTTQTDDAVMRLTDELGLLDTEQDGSLRLHRLLSTFTRNASPDPQAQNAVERALIRIAYDLNNKGFPAPLLAIQTHLRHVTDTASTRQDEQAAALCSNLGYHFKMLGAYTDARTYLERALSIREKVLPEDHPDIALSLNNMGSLLHAQGDYVAARTYLERALSIVEKVLPPDHPDIALSLNNLGMLLWAQGEYDAARTYYERALSIWEKVLPEDHPNIALSLNNLGMLLQDQGDYAAARTYLERALSIKEKVLSENHPSIAISLNNLGSLLQDQGDYAAARTYLERALSILEKVLPPDHPDIASSLNNLGSLSYYQGDFQAASDFMQRALSIREKVLGPTHPYTQSSKRNLTIIQQEL